MVSLLHRATINNYITEDCAFCVLVCATCHLNESALSLFVSPGVLEPSWYPASFQRTNDPTWCAENAGKVKTRRHKICLHFHTWFHIFLYSLHLVVVSYIAFFPHFVYYFLWSPYVIGRPYIFSCCGLFFFLLSSFFPRLISAAADWMSTILRHMVWS